MAAEDVFTAELNEPEMAALAQKLAPLLKRRDCIALYGDLGAGKSSFIRACIHALAKAKEVPSPTFTLVQTYESPAGALWHFDLYRVKKTSEILELGWDEALHDGIIFVEWPERLGALLPQRHLAIHLNFHQDSAKRRISIQGDAPWPLRLSPVLPKAAKM
ncbi:MAG: tRNA (adenosine(37)-N6)-threonylcarbamoyltransferase complex ATPase subunit type 1 TsaE [Proteobacteria bacterium]|nr:tRNA (adenosine(37)-N6)-threonylcarbamoyltransferase complex ATPase subunit type 1 TsaE [Pseudomonadota bacterium]